MAKKTKQQHQALTLKERCHLLHGNGEWKLHGCKRLGIEGIEMNDGPLGLRVRSPKEVDSTCYPAPCLLACSWDVELEKQIGRAIAEECALKGTDVLLAPGVNIKRNPLCGRNFEYLSEDPLISGEMGAAFIQGVQSNSIAACVKHFACNSQENYRFINDSIVDERAMHEIYLKAFEIVVKEARPWSMMSAYNIVNGVHCSDNEYLLVDTLRDSWGYEGVVMSDWGGTYDPVYSHQHGLDVEMPCYAKERTAELLRATKSGRLSLDKMTESADRVLNLISKIREGNKVARWDARKCHELAVKAAEESIVLLKNENNILPLSKTLMGACVIGAFAETPRYNGGGSSKVYTEHSISFLDAINRELPFARGYSLKPNSDSKALLFNAVDLASRSKTVLYFMGLPEEDESEGYDRETMNLPENQLALFDALYSVNPNIVVILSCGAPVVLPFRDRAKAILLTYLAGEGSGEALRDILSGECSPCGKLAETWPIHESDVPSFGFYPGFQGQSIYKESIYVGYRYYLTSGVKVAYPFGHGLSYNRFSYSLRCDSSRLETGKTIRVYANVTNKSSRPGKTVLELYAESPKGNAFKAKRVLVAFKKVALKEGETQVVSFDLAQSDFAIYDTETHAFQVEGGTYILALGTSSENIVSTLDLIVDGTRTFPNLREKCPIYYAVPHGGFTQYDDEFEMLLGRPLTLDKDRRERPFDRDSTMGDISWTAVGKKRRKQFVKEHADWTPIQIKSGFDDAPIRQIAKDQSERDVRRLIDYANGHYIRGFIHGLIPTKTKDFYADQKTKKK